MPLTYREAIMQALVAKLSELGGTVIRNPEDVYEGPYPAFLVYDGEQDADNSNHGLTRYRMTVPVEIIVQSSATDIGTALNAKYGEVVAKLADDPTLGGVAVDLFETSTTNPDIDETRASKRVGTIGIAFAVDYMTETGNPFVG
ncbi:hypothetical protein [Caenispirillum bisanense]|uniref:hypothetical protein n=1 Tax=Caenispirillum bisanense TaxID=414052 RepID=UPI00114254D6|nr:hypothetical protein [Caenispirillum bisanense]